MILVATPSKDMVNAGYAVDLFNLGQHSPDVKFCIMRGTVLPSSRTELARYAIEDKTVTHVLYIDSDMRFPADLAERLVAHDLDIVAANCVKRGTTDPLGQKDGSVVQSKDKTGLEEVDFIGFGVILIKRSVFEKMPQPWFLTPFEAGNFIGEDIYFCHKAQAAKIPIYVDHDVSQQIGHEGMEAHGILG